MKKYVLALTETDNMIKMIIVPLNDQNKQLLGESLNEDFVFECEEGEEQIKVQELFHKMEQRQMFEKSFERPRIYKQLTEEEQLEIDKDLGILDWNGEDLSEKDIVRMKTHYI